MKSNGLKNTMNGTIRVVMKSGGFDTLHLIPDTITNNGNGADYI